MSAKAELDSPKQLNPNLVLVAKRKEKGWESRGKAVRELRKLGLQHGLPVPDIEAMTKAVYRHETGRSLVRDQLYIDLYCLAYNATQHELFGDVTPINIPGQQYGVRSHKFIPFFLGSEATKNLTASLAMEPVPQQWLECSSKSIEHPDGNATLYVWPFGVAMIHLIEELTFPHVAKLAVWRHHSYDENISWASDYLQNLVGTPAKSLPYVLSLYWLHTPIWSGGELETALRLLCMPRVLLEHDDSNPGPPLAHAELVERSLLYEGFNHAEMVSFGVKGISLGFASWAGVVYYPLAHRRALRENEVVACELAAQASWSYCDYIRTQVEQGEDPVVASEFGWRFVRGIRSRLINPRPRETQQHRSMREAVLETSGLTHHLTQAYETLRETHEG